MKVKLTFFILATCFVALFVLNTFAQLPQNPTPPSLDQQTAQDDDQEDDIPSADIDTPLQLQIDKHRPDYLFKVSAYHNQADLLSNETQHVTIKISRIGSSSKPIQTITLKVRDDISPSIELEDINFDGYPDIKMVTDFGGKFSDYNYWLFDKQSGRFISNSLSRQMQRVLAGYNDLTFDSDTHTILAHNIGPCYARVKSFKIVHNTLLFINSVTDIGCDYPSQSDSDDSTHLLIKQRLHGKIKTTKTITKDAGDITDIYHNIFP